MIASAGFCIFVIQKSAKNIKITATAFDGTVEAIEIPGERMVLGVQFHPERMDDIGPCFFALLKTEAEKYRQKRLK